MNSNILYLQKQRREIIKNSVDINYDDFEYEGDRIGFDYEKMMNASGYTLDDIRKIQNDARVGDTPLVELKNLTTYARKYAKDGYGAKILLKDEAANLSGSFKARRAAISVHKAKSLGYKGVVAATSGNYGAAVAAMAAKYGLKCIIVQECFDSENVSQPEILEKARACEAFGAEVIQLSVGPELFYVFLDILNETGYFNASLYSPYGIMGIETLGHEIATETKSRYGRHPDVVVCTNAGGGNLTGTARGLMKAGAKQTKVYAASVDLTGLHMASDKDFNRKSFTTGHTGFGIPFAVDPDRIDVPRSAARPLRYMDRYFTVNQGCVFFITEALAVLEGMERGLAGNISLAVVFKLAQTMKEGDIIVAQETEYTGAGKHHQPQLSFAVKNDITLKFGNPADEIPGRNIIFPKSAADIDIKEIDMDRLRKSYIKRVDEDMLMEEDLAYVAAELKITPEKVRELMDSMSLNLGVRYE